MYQPIKIKNHSIVPAIALFGVMFAVGMYAGTAFAAMVNSNTSVTVSAQSPNGSNGAPGKPGKDGADGINGSASASVKVKTIVNGKVVQDIDEERHSSNGEGVSVEVRGNNVSWSTSSESTPSPIAVTNRSVARVGNVGSPVPESASDIRAVAGQDLIAASSTGISGHGGLYSFLKSFFIHVASFFRV